MGRLARHHRRTVGDGSIPSGRQGLPRIRWVKSRWALVSYFQWALTVAGPREFGVSSASLGLFGLSPLLVPVFLPVPPCQFGMSFTHRPPRGRRLGTVPADTQGLKFLASLGAFTPIVRLSFFRATCVPCGLLGRPFSQQVLAPSPLIFAVSAGLATGLALRCWLPATLCAQTMFSGLPPPFFGGEIFSLLPDLWVFCGWVSLLC